MEFRQSADVLDAWAERLAEHGLSGRRILVEITEGLLVELSDTVRDQFERLQGMGISLSLDDFGTGYSSLAYLRKFDVDFLKIDRAFVQGVERGSDDLALCEAIIVMAQKLGIEVVAEGIETEDQCALLVTAGCRLGQGFLFSSPPTRRCLRRLSPRRCAARLRRERRARQPWARYPAANTNRA